MTILKMLIIGVGGFLGAIIRYALSKKWNAPQSFSYGTLSVNLMGSFLIGFIIGLSLPTVWVLLLVSGFMGALTTFSTLQKEIIERWQGGMRKNTIVYLVVTYTGGILLAYLGYIISSAY